MSAEDTLRAHAERQGWSLSTQLALVLEYVENQQDAAAFGDFLQTHADAEADDLWCRVCHEDTEGGEGQDGLCGNCADVADLPHRIEYSRFMGQHENVVFPNLEVALTALEAELHDLRSTQGDAAWKRQDDPQGYDATGLRVLYEHVSWDPNKPERIALVTDDTPEPDE